MGAKENNVGINKVQTYQNFSTVINLDTSRKTFRIESG